jgi:hypothetical protein
MKILIWEDRATRAARRYSMHGSGKRAWRGSRPAARLESAGGGFPIGAGCAVGGGGGAALVVAAAGNGASTSRFYPAAYDHVISVAAGTVAHQQLIISGTRRDGHDALTVPSDG